MIMKLRCLFFLMICAMFSHAQEKKILSIELNRVYEPSIGKEIYTGKNVFLNENLVPVYVFQKLKEKKGEVNKFNIKVLKSSRVKGKLPVNNLPLGLNQSISFPKEINQEYLTIEFNPIYRNDKNEIIQVEEVEISYTISNENKSRFSRVNKQKFIENSVLSTGTWYKFAVDKTGVFKIDYNFLKSLGIDAGKIDPKKIRIFGHGGNILPEDLSIPREEGLIENAIKIIGEEDGRFDKNDVILFYGEGTVSWDFGRNRTSISHKQNVYSKYGYYFINVDSGLNGKRINNSNTINLPKTIDVTTFTDYQLNEKELLNYVRVGREWYGEDFALNRNQSFNFNFPNIVKTQDVIVDGRFSAVSSKSTNYEVSYSGIDQINTTVGALTDKNGFSVAVGKGSFLPSNDLVRLNVIYRNNGDNSARAHLDYLRVVADRFLAANGSQFNFFNYSSLLNGEVLEYTLNNANLIDEVWDISDLRNVKKVNNILTSGTQFKFRAFTDGKIDNYCLVKVSDAYTPIKIDDKTRVNNQNLHALEGIQYLIVTTKELMSQANRLKTYHENNTSISETNSTKIKGAVIDVEQIYNEFGSGVPDVTAIRDFVKHIYDKNLSDDDRRLKYLCLFGDDSFDFRKIMFNSSNIIPSYVSNESRDLLKSYNTDDYYGYLDEIGQLSASGKLDISTGRIPVSNVREANVVVNKILKYYSPESNGDWKNKITLLGDDGQENKSQQLIKFLENSAKKIEGNNESLNLLKLYSDAFKEEVTAGGQSYPEVKKRFLDSFDQGALVINYFGHGNVSALGEENFLDINDVKKIRNTKKLPLFITVTCDFSRFDDPDFLSGGEEMMLSPLGGASSMITTSRQITITTGNTINSNLADYLYNNTKSSTIAEALKNVKNSGTSRSRNEFFVFFFGDPLMRLSIPRKKIKIDKVKKYFKDIEGNDSLVAVSQLQALSKLNVTGKVTNNDGSDIDNFKGEVFVTLYGEEINRETLLNEEGGVNSTNIGRVVKFKSLENRVFSGLASVDKGQFSLDLILPKDIGSVVETSKFSMYASSDNEQGAGFDKSFMVGGIDPDVEEDKTPPVINLFMENKFFVEGGNTSTTPILIAEIQDESGINTTLSSIGHNISLVIDGDFSNPVSLNDFYTTKLDTFEKGSVNYELEELEEGSHTITFKAWDTHNNSSTKTLSFFVVNDAGFKISKVLNYPNPFINYTQFWFTNNSVGEALAIKVQIYTVSGKLVKSIIANDPNEGGIVRSVNWDGKDDFGNKLGKGVYLYKLTVKQTISGGTDEKIEKLVIL